MSDLKKHSFRVLSATMATALALNAPLYANATLAKGVKFVDEFGSTIESTQKVEGTDYTVYMLANNNVYVDTSLEGTIKYNIMYSTDKQTWQDVNSISEPDKQDTWFNLEKGYCTQDHTYELDDNVDYAKVQVTQKTSKGYEHTEDIILKYNDFSKAREEMVKKSLPSIDEVTEISRTEDKVKVKVKASTQNGTLCGMFFGTQYFDLSGKSVEKTITLTSDDTYDISVVNTLNYRAEAQFNLKWFSTLEETAEVKNEYVPNDSVASVSKGSWELTCSKVPNKATEPFDLTIKTTKPTTISVNGIAYSSRKTLKYEVASNGVYDIVARDTSGVIKKKTITVNAFKNTAGLNDYDNDERYSFGDATTTKTGTLPQTGGLKPVIIVGGFISCIVVGALLLLKRKKVK